MSISIALPAKLWFFLAGKRRGDERAQCTWGAKAFFAYRQMPIEQKMRLCIRLRAAFRAEASLSSGYGFVIFDSR